METFWPGEATGKHMSKSVNEVTLEVTSIGKEVQPEMGGLCQGKAYF
jgi:hypothetical protein